MAGSLKSTVTSESVANEIIHEWKSPAYNNKVLVLVEGKDDRIFYYKFFNKDFSEIKDCKGCKKVIEVYRILQSKAKFLNITIKDSDFDRINGKPKSGVNFFYSDCHDYEMMCLRNKGTLEKLFANLAIDYDEAIINSVFEDLRYLSFFKWYNYTNHCNFNFRGFKITDKTREQLYDFEYIHGNLSYVSRNCISINKETLNNFINDNADYDLYEITNGHDFITRLIFHIKQKDSSMNNINEEKLKLTLHPCFDINDFEKTDLYCDIKHWETLAGKTILCVS